MPTMAFVMMMDSISLAVAIATEEQTAQTAVPIDPLFLIAYLSIQEPNVVY